MSITLQDSVVLITSANANALATDFGTGFVVYYDEHASYVVTCAHVVSVVGVNSILVAHQPASIVDIEEDIDVAILRVVDLQKLPSLPLQLSGEKGMPFITAGFQLYDKPRYLIRPLRGTLGEQGGLETRDGTYRTKSWDLIITDTYQLQRGYSGSPVVAESTGYVIGIVTSMEGSGQKGAARSVEAISHIWHNMPPSVFVTAPAYHSIVASTHHFDDAAIPEPVQRIPFTSKERRELARLLWKCNSISNHELRSSIVIVLEREFNTSITRNRNDDLADIRHIVDACEYFENFTPLIEEMQDREQNAPPMQAVENFLYTRQR